MLLASTHHLLSQIVLVTFARLRPLCTDLVDDFLPSLLGYSFPGLVLGVQIFSMRFSWSLCMLCSFPPAVGNALLCKSQTRLLNQLTEHPTDR